MRLSGHAVPGALPVLARGYANYEMIYSHKVRIVIPAKAGIQGFYPDNLDPRLRGDDVAVVLNPASSKMLIQPEEI